MDASQDLLVLTLWRPTFELRESVARELIVFNAQELTGALKEYGLEDFDMFSLV